MTTVIDPDLRRPFNREYSLGIEHQLAANLRLSVMFNRREQRDLRATINRAVPTESYIPVPITNPLTNEPLTISNQSPATTGRQDNVLTNRSELDTSYNGIDISLVRRFGAGSQVQGGYSYGKNLGRITSADPSDPNTDIFTDGAVGSDEPHQFKVSGNTWRDSTGGAVGLRIIVLQVGSGSAMGERPAVTGTARCPGQSGAARTFATD